MNRRTAALSAALIVALAGLGGPAAAHAPDPVRTSTNWPLDHTLSWHWWSNQVPPAKMQPAIQAAASDSSASKNSRAAKFTFSSSGAGKVGYTSNWTCDPAGIGCMGASPPSGSFTVVFREQGHRFDWGTLKWCQFYDTYPDGCFDVENIMLDELGHVEGLAHHGNYDPDSDYTDAVVQEVSRQKPKTGWNAHAYGRCDVATLQREYDVPAWTAKYSTCLDLVTVLTLSASSTSITAGQGVTFSAVLKVQTNTAYELMSNNPISGRTVSLQRRTPGSSSWTTVATMAQSPTAGTYTSSWSPTATYEWRAVFSKPANEGLRSSASSGVKVTVWSCSQPPCPSSITADQ